MSISISKQSGEATLLQSLRDATHECHQSLDGMFGTLDLENEADFLRFLTAHFMGTQALYPAFRNFVGNELCLPVPDFPAMLSEDLQSNRIAKDDLPRIDAGAGLAPAAVAYVLCGSRLGLAMLRKRGYWRGYGDSRYMEDTAGLDIWRALLTWLGSQAPNEAAREQMSASAVRCFDVFRDAFALSGKTARPA